MNSLLIIISNNWTLGLIVTPNNLIYAWFWRATLEDDFGNWVKSHDLTQPRYDHVSWRNEQGVLLIGGKIATNMKLGLYCTLGFGTVC